MILRLCQKCKDVGPPLASLFGSADVHILVFEDKKGRRGPGEAPHPSTSGLGSRWAQPPGVRTGDEHV